MMNFGKSNQTDGKYMWCDILRFDRRKSMQMYDRGNSSYRIMPPPSDYMTSRTKDQAFDPKEKKVNHIMTQEEVAAGKPTVMDQIELVGGIRNVPPVLFNYESLRFLFLAHNRIQYLPPEICELRNLQYLDISYNQITQLPREIGCMYELRELHCKINMLTTVPVELGRLFQLKMLTLEGNPLQSEINMMFDGCGGVNGTPAFVHMLMDRNSNFGSTPPERTWRPLCDPINGAIQFTLMCYNILCEKYASPQIYPYCPAWALNWVYRRQAIMDELRLYSADIICLQEVEMDQYDSHFEKTLKSFGYQGIFSPKSRAHHMNESERRKVDGCAIFWKHERFRLVKDAVIEFSRMAMERYENDCKESPEMLNRVMIRDNIALSAILETKESNQQFMVSTAHIHWDPEYSDVKLIQSIMHISSLYKKIEEHLLEQNGGSGPVNPSSMPLIVCGDFNSLPQSGVVEFLTTGRVAKSHPDFKNLGYVKVLDKLCSRRKQPGRNAALPDPDMLHHDFVLGRAYDYGEGMRYTNYTYDFKGIIDYIFYTKDHFNLLGNLEMISEDWLKKEKVPGCPHPHIASDHFPLLVELELKPPGSERGHSSSHSLRK